MNLKDRYGTSKKKEQEGVLFEVGETEDGKLIAFRVLRMSAKNRKLQKEMAKHRSVINSSSNSPVHRDRAEDAMIEVLIHSVIVSWQNIEPFEGCEFLEKDEEENLVFNETNARFILKQFPDLMEEIAQFAQDADNFRERDDDAKK